MIRPARPEDAAYVLAVRNLPDVRAASLDTREITAEEHARWWADGGQAQTWIIFSEAVAGQGVTGCLSISRAGYVRVSYSGYVSVAIQGWARGHGLAAQAIRMIQMRHALLRADVRADNEASRRLFLRCGFMAEPHGCPPPAVMRYEWSAN